MRATRVPFSRIAIAGALTLACAAALSPSAHADPGRGWDNRHDRGHGRPHFDPRPRYHGHGADYRGADYRGAGYHGPRYYAPPRAHYHSNLAPIIGAGILLGTVAALASPPVVVAAPPPPVVVRPAPMPMYGVTELGPVRY
jgi:hypothetical protein